MIEATLHCFFALVEEFEKLNIDDSNVIDEIEKDLLE